MPGLILPTGLATGYDAMAGWLWATHTTFLTSCIVISTPFRPPEKHLAVSCLQHMPARSKLSPSGYRHLTPVLSRLHYEPWCHAGTCFSASDDYMKVWYVSFATYVPHTHRSQNKVLGFTGFVTVFVWCSCVYYCVCKRYTGVIFTCF
jgi:hypothetical protein